MEPFPVLARYQEEFSYHLDPVAVERLNQYRQMLLEWNQRFNLTRVADPGEIEIRLFLDALAMLRYIRTPLQQSATESPLRLVDIGAGAGFPGLPLKIVAPEIELVLIEATAKKVGFLDEVIRVLGLSGTMVIHGRAEALAHDEQFRAAFDVVTARAVARLPALIEICMPFCRVGGRGIFPKGSGIDEEIVSASKAEQRLRCKIIRSEPMTIPELSGTTFVIIQQIGKPPGRFPRRPGIPAKDPL